MCDFEIGLRESLQLLRATHGEFLSSARQGRYSLWIGSGISRRRFPSVPRLMEQLLRTLHAEMNPTDPSCPYLVALKEILNIIHFHEDGLDLGLPPDEWPLDNLRQQMSDRYAEILDVAVREPGNARDLVWDVLCLPEVYSDPAVEPDAEHFLIALLVEEQVVHRLLTTNWDVLIERAHRAIVGDDTRALPSIASNDDLAVGVDVALFKVHGCAEKAHNNRNAYGRFLVATERQITGWGQGESSRPFRERANTLLRETAALFIGLSGQDGNLRNVVEASTEGRILPYSASPPKVVFSATEVDPRRRSILSRIYTDYDDRHEEIDAGACLRPCAKALLGALYVDAMEQKIDLLIADASADATFPQRLVPLLTEWRDHVREEVADRVDRHGDLDERWMWLAREVPRIISHVVSLMRRSQWTHSDDHYMALLPESLPRLSQPSPLREEAGYHWLVLALAALWEGANRGWWTIDIGLRQAPGVTGTSLVLRRPDGRIGVVISSKPKAAYALLLQNGILGEGTESHVILVYPTGHRPAMHHPVGLTRSLPGSRVHGPVEVWLQDLLDDGDLDTLANALRDEVLQAEAVA